MEQLTCENTTLDVFIQCLIHKNLKALGEHYTEAEQKELWSALYLDYMRRCGGETHKYLFSLYKRKAVLEAKIKIAELILAIPMTDGDRTKQLKEIGYSGDLRSITAKIKTDTVLYQNAEKELEKAQKNKGGETLSEQGFTQWIILVSRFMGYNIDRKKITVAEFLEMNRQFEEDAKLRTKRKRHEKA
jgi:uncharacterized protein YcgL (UPF0745 family)